MSAAATAAGYLYASGRLRGRSKDGDEPEKRDYKETSAPPKRRLRIAAIPEQPIQQAAPEPAPRARPAPKIEYRVRRWRPE
jgi:hypothetical protein